MADGLAYGREFSGDFLTQIAMPMGGLGAGCICLNGVGGLQDFSIRHKPGLSAVADGFDARDAGFAIVHVKGAGTRLVEGPMPLGKIYDQGLKGQGYRAGGFEGLPRFGGCSFRGAYPFGEVRLWDEGMPVKVRMTGWNPFIPLDDVNSGLPCAILEYEIENTSERPIEIEFSYHLTHLAREAGARKGGWKATRNRVVEGAGGAGVTFYNVEPEGSAGFGSASLSVVGHLAAVKGMWMRSGWFDWISALWQEVSTGNFRENAGNTERELDGHNGGSVLVRGRLAPGERATYPVVITWHFPNVHYGVVGFETTTCCDGGECAEPKWRPFYATQWADAEAVGAYVREHFAELRARTKGFADAFFSSTLPAEVLDAVSSNLAILKSPTVLRQENGHVWGWEGCFSDRGCCSGTCTHVWNYAQSMPHLFPQLERGLREMEFQRSMDELGHVTFRAALPDGPVKHEFHAAADGQLGGMMKLYRDWQVSGDAAWMKGLYPLAKRSLAWCMRKWDPEERGALFEPHHNTYDIEFWGPDGMCTSVYVGALAAMAEMARAVGDAEAATYAALAEKGARFMDEALFNGEYFEQRVMWRELRDQSFVRSLENGAERDEEELRVVRDEGPKHQYGSGCLSDGVIGAWMARLYGVEAPLDGKHVRKNLAAIFRHNFRADLRGHACTQRPGYAMGNEAGLLLCSWPRGRRPTLPFVYCDEVWTGIEYQVASHLMMEGMVEEGLAIVKGVRGRYEGRVRNPFNEYECGNYYARAMASYALLAGMSGISYSAATRELRVAPRVGAPKSRCFFSAATGFGVVELEGDVLRVEMVEGVLDVGAVKVEWSGKRFEFEWGMKVGGRAEVGLRGAQAVR